MDLDAAGVRLLEPGDQAQAGRLARTGWAEQGEELAVRDLEAHAVDGADLAEVATHGGEPHRGDGCLEP